MTGCFPARQIFPFALAVLLSLPAAVYAQRAQAPVTSFDQLGALLPIGTTITVETANGHKLTGTLRGLSTTGLELDAGGVRTLDANDVRRIDRVKSAPVGMGTLLGLAVGGVVALSAMSDNRTPSCGESGGFRLCLSSDDFLPSREVLAGGALVAGAILGGVIGAAVGSSHTQVYQAPGAARITLAPHVSRGRSGITVVIAF